MNAVFAGAVLRAVSASGQPDGAPRPELEARRGVRLAVIVPRLPYPARRDGMAVRYCPLIDFFAERYELDVLVLGPRDATVAEGAPSWARNAIYVEWPAANAMPVVARLATLTRVYRPGGHPRNQSVHRASLLADDLAALLTARRVNVVVWVGPGGIDLADRVRRRTPAVRWAVDFIDSPTRLTVNLHRATGIARWWQRLEVRRTRAWESRVRRSFDVAMYTTQADAEAAGPTGPAVHVMPNGVLGPEPSGAGQNHDPAPAPVVGFLGNLHYPPNAAAVRRLHDRIFPSLRERVPDAALLLIGRGPPSDLIARASAGVAFTGEVESIWDPMARVTVFVFPVDTGAGMQNKLMEAMIVGGAVVTTAGCAAAIGATPGVHCVVANTDQEFVDAASRLLRDDTLRGDLGSRARAFAAERFDWRQLLPQFERLVVGPDG